MGGGKDTDDTNYSDSSSPTAIGQGCCKLQAVGGGRLRWIRWIRRLRRGADMLTKGSACHHIIHDADVFPLAFVEIEDECQRADASAHAHECISGRRCVTDLLSSGLFGWAHLGVPSSYLPRL
eukprot:946825-Prorocentrum_minimum.AAC.1